jgi:hypothetical protein
MWSGSWSTLSSPSRNCKHNHGMAVSSCQQCVTCLRAVPRSSGRSINKTENMRSNSEEHCNTFLRSTYRSLTYQSVTLTSDKSSSHARATHTTDTFKPKSHCPNSTVHQLWTRYEIPRADHTHETLPITYMPPQRNSPWPYDMVSTGGRKVKIRVSMTTLTGPMQSWYVCCWFVCDYCFG